MYYKRVIKSNKNFQVEPFDYTSPYYYNPVYSIFNYTESCSGCQLEDYFLTKTKEQKTSEISAIARTFSSMLNKNPSTGCPLIAPCDNTTVVNYIFQLSLLQL